MVYHQAPRTLCWVKTPQWNFEGALPERPSSIPYPNLRVEFPMCCCPKQCVPQCLLLILRAVRWNVPNEAFLVQITQSETARQTAAWLSLTAELEDSCRAEAQPGQITRVLELPNWNAACAWALLLECRIVNVP